MIDADTIYYILTDIECPACFLDNYDAFEFAKYLAGKLKTAIAAESLQTVQELGKSENYCVVCGETIPEGRQVCWICEHKLMGDEEQ